MKEGGGGTGGRRDFSFRARRDGPCDLHVCNFQAPPQTLT